MTTAMSTISTCPVASFAWMKVVSSSSIRWRTPDGPQFVVPGWEPARAAGQDEAPLVAIHRAPPAEPVAVHARGGARRGRPLSVRGGDRRKRASRSPLETLRLWHRDGEGQAV